MEELEISLGMFGARISHRSGEFWRTRSSVVAVYWSGPSGTMNAEYGECHHGAGSSATDPAVSFMRQWGNETGKNETIPAQAAEEDIKGRMFLQELNLERGRSRCMSVQLPLSWA